VSRQFAGVAHAEQGAGIAEKSSGVQRVEQVRASQHRQAEGGRLQQVMPARGRDAAAHKGQVRRCVEEDQLP